MANTTGKRTKKTTTAVEELINKTSNIFTFSFKRRKGQVFNLNENTIFSIPEFYACVRVLAQSIASLPINIYNSDDKSKLTIEDDDLVYKVDDIYFITTQYADDVIFVKPVTKLVEVTT
jgi:phage portal protein BeeE